MRTGKASRPRPKPAARPLRLHYGPCPRERGWSPAVLLRLCQPRPPPSAGRQGAPRPPASPRRCPLADPGASPPFLRPGRSLNSSPRWGENRLYPGALRAQVFRGASLLQGKAHLLSSSISSITTSCEPAARQAGAQLTACFAHISQSGSEQVGAEECFSPALRRICV